MRASIEVGCLVDSRRPSLAGLALLSTGWLMAVRAELMLARALLSDLDIAGFDTPPPMVRG